MSWFSFIVDLARQLAPFAVIVVVAVAVGVLAYLAPLVLGVIFVVGLIVAAVGAVVLWLIDEWRSWTERRR